MANVRFSYLLNNFSKMFPLLVASLKLGLGVEALDSSLCEMILLSPSCAVFVGAVFDSSLHPPLLSMLSCEGTLTCSCDCRSKSRWLAATFVVAFESSVWIVRAPLPCVSGRGKITTASDGAMWVALEIPTSVFLTASAGILFGTSKCKEFD